MSTLTKVQFLNELYDQVFARVMHENPEIAYGNRSFLAHDVADDHVRRYGEKEFLEYSMKGDPYNVQVDLEMVS